MIRPMSMSRNYTCCASFVLLLSAHWACTGGEETDLLAASNSSSSASGVGAQGGTGGTGGTMSSGGAGGAGMGGSGGQGVTGPDVDTSDPQLYESTFNANEADPLATERLGTQSGFLDTTATPRGTLVVYLHGAGDPDSCGSTAHGRMLAGLGFHVFSPCYHSGYGVGNCGDDIEGCRLEAFEGVDHHSLIDVSRPNSTEERIIQGMAYLQQQVPQGDWTYFVDGGQPRWDRIIVSGISHGASSAGVIALHRFVERAVMLSGPLDGNQPWLSKIQQTPKDRLWAFSHTDDTQHPGHLDAFEAMGIVGAPTSVDNASSPYGGSHRLISSADTSNGHSGVQAGGASPKDMNDAYLYAPVWEQLYTGE